MGNFSKTEEFYKKALQTLSNLFGENNENVAWCYHQLGALFSDLSNLSKCEEFLMKSFKFI